MGNASKKHWGMHYRVGDVFNSMTQMVYGGEVSANGNNDPEIGNIDVIDFDNNRAYEAKGSISSDCTKLCPDQIARYSRLSEVDYEEEFPLDHPKVYFCFWQYRKHRVRKHSQNENKISEVPKGKFEEVLMERLNRLLVVSFDVIKKGETIWDKNAWDQYMFRSNERKDMTKDTSRELRRMGLNSSKYLVSEEMVPAGEYIHTTRLTRIPKEIAFPEFKLTTIINNKWGGLERRTKGAVEFEQKELAAVPF
jgi:hypothetical protein